MEETTPQAEEELAVDRFHQRFADLADEAAAEGVAVVWVVSYDDRLAGEEYCRMGRSNAGPVLTLGMLEYARVAFRKETKKYL